MNNTFHDLEKELGLSIRYFESIPSTSLFLKEQLLAGEKPYDLVIAGEQTNGQGRVGKSFYSPADSGLYLTFAFPVEKYNQDHVTPKLSLAVCHAIESVFPVKCGVKWVNDIYLSNRKIAGILCQRVNDHFLFGIGINVEEPNSIPKELQDRFGFISKDCDPICYSRLVKELYRNILSVQNVSQEALLSEYTERCIHIGKKVSILSDAVECVGICIGIQQDFSIELIFQDQKCSFSSGIMTILQ